MGSEDYWLLANILMSIRRYPLRVDAEQLKLFRMGLLLGSLSGALFFSEEMHLLKTAWEI